MNFAMDNTVNIEVNIRGLQTGPGKFFMGILEKSYFFVVVERVGTLHAVAYCSQEVLLFRGGVCCRIWNAIVSHRRRAAATSAVAPSSSASATNTSSAPDTSS